MRYVGSVMLLEGMRCRHQSKLLLTSVSLLEAVVWSQLHGLDYSLFNTTIGH